MDEERVVLTIEQAENLIADGEYVHTFRQGGFMLIGADWKREDILEALKIYPPELSGVSATSIGHGLVFIDKAGPVFVETKTNG